MRIEENVPLGPLTTLGIGGAARWFAEAVSETEVLEAIRWANARRLPLFVLGGGSNLLISDQGFPGLTLRIGLKGVESREDGDCVLLDAAAGEQWDAMVSLAVGRNCAGIECLAGIPGSVGGTPVQNVGAYGQEVAETIQRVRILDLKTLAFRWMTAVECAFAYRASVFNTAARGRYLVSRVEYRLRRDGAVQLRYADIEKAFGAGAKPSLTEVAAAVRRIRREKGMLLVEGDADCRSAGSFFKNPVIAAEAFEKLERDTGMSIPHYPAAPGIGGEERVKLPAAWLIERAGFHKGFAMGAVGISSRHTLALVNRGGASAQELLALRDRIVSRVLDQFGISLEMEPVMVGF
jgi:UDP-N-acetylmuramate dehydrogenase